MACVLVEALRDAKDQLGFAFWRPNFEEQRKGFLEDELPQTLDALTRFFEANPAGATFWAGASLSLADLLAFAYLDDVEALAGERIDQRHAQGLLVLDHQDARHAHAVSPVGGWASRGTTSSNAMEFMRSGRSMTITRVCGRGLSMRTKLTGSPEVGAMVQPRCPKR